MRALTWIVLLVVALSGVLAFAGLLGTESDVSYQMLPATCAITVIGVPLFLLLAARQSRKDREARERRERVNRQFPPELQDWYRQTYRDAQSRQESQPRR